MSALEHLTAELESARGLAARLEVKNAELRRVVAAWHRPVPSFRDGKSCVHCGSSWPCPTIRAIEAVGAP